MTDNTTNTLKIELDFYRTIAQNAQLFTIMDEQGIPAPQGEDGHSVMPFWSTEQNALNFIQQNDGFNHFKPYPIEWTVFQDKWIEGIANDDLLVGINWHKLEEDGCVTEIELMLKGITDILKTQPLKK